MEDSSDKLADGLIGLVIWAFSLPVVLFTRAYCLSTVWSWYAVESLGAPALPILNAFGLFVFVTMLGMTNRKTEIEWGKGDVSIQVFAYMLAHTIAPLFPLFIAYLVIK